MSAPSVRSFPAPGRRVVSSVEFDVVWEWLGLGAAPVVLRLDSPGRTHTERRQIVDAGWQGLRQRGLANLTGPEPELVRLMHLLAAPTSQIELRMRLDRELRAIAAGRPGTAALAVRRDDTVTLSALTQPVLGVVNTMPTIGTGAGHSVTLPSADLDAASNAAAGGEPIAETLHQHGLDRADAELVSSILGGVTGRGQLSALSADNWGVLHRSPRVIGVLDTRYGRYLTQRDVAADGSEWTTLAPVDAVRLRYRIEELLLDAEHRAHRI